MYIYTNMYAYIYVYCIMIYLCIYTDANLTCPETAPPIKGSEGTEGGTRGGPHRRDPHTGLR